MRILYVADTYYPHVNGVYYFVQRLALALQDQGYVVAVMVPSQSIRHSETFIQNIKVFGVASVSIFFYQGIRLPIPFFLKPRIRRLLKEFKPDVIHIQNHFRLNKLLLKVNKDYKIPVIATNHFMPENFTAFIRSPKWKVKIANWLWRDFAKVFNQASVVTTPTQTAAQLIQCFLRVRVVVISNGIDLTKFAPVPNMESTIRAKFSLPPVPIILCVGRLDPEKHIEEIIEAVSLIKENDFCLVIVGKGHKKISLEQLAKKKGIAHKVFFTGFVSDFDLLEMFKASYCFVTASIAELQSLATMEAMACGLPVIAAKAGALEELVFPHKNGFLYDPGDITHLAFYLKQILEAKDLKNSMSQSSLSIIAQHDIRNTITRYAELYQSYIH